MPNEKRITANGSTRSTSSGRTKLTAKQLNILNDLFEGDTNEEQIFEKHKINRRTYDKWMCDANFISEFDRRFENARRQNDLLIARFANNAVVKLISLCNSETEEIARKACLDIIGLLHPAEKRPDSAPPDDAPDNISELPPELAGKLLAAIAGNEGQATSGA